MLLRQYLYCGNEVVVKVTTTYRICRIENCIGNYPFQYIHTAEFTGVKAVGIPSLSSNTDTMTRALKNGKTLRLLSALPVATFVSQ